MKGFKQVIVKGNPMLVPAYEWSMFSKVMLGIVLVALFLWSGYDAKL